MAKGKTKATKAKEKTHDKNHKANRGERGRVPDSRPVDSAPAAPAVAVVPGQVSDLDPVVSDVARGKGKGVLETPLQKSVGHACFARRGADGWEAVLGSELKEAEVEFHVNGGGYLLMRTPIAAPIGADGSRVGEQTTNCVTGAFHIVTSCRKLGCKVPDATARRLAEMEAAVAKPGGPPLEGTTPQKKGRVMKGKTSGKTIGEYWEQLFVENAKKKATDAELIKKAEAEFPDSKGKATTNRPRMYRSHYNNGTFTFLKDGSAKKRNLPESHEYDRDGNVVAPGTRRAAAGRTKEHPAKAKGKAAKKAVRKPAGKSKAAAAGKKRVVRRASKA